MLQNKPLPLLHQQLPVLLRLLHSEREPLTTPRLTPIGPLARNVSRANNVHIRVDQKERQDLAIPSLRRIHQLKRLHLVLNGIGERDEPAFGGGCAPDGLHEGAVLTEAVDRGKPVMVVGWVVHVVVPKPAAMLPEG